MVSLKGTALVSGATPPVWVLARLSRGHKCLEEDPRDVKGPSLCLLAAGVDPDGWAKVVSSCPLQRDSASPSPRLRSEAGGAAPAQAGGH